MMVHGDHAEEMVVRLCDGLARPVAVDVSDAEVLEAPAEGPFVDGHAGHAPGCSTAGTPASTPPPASCEDRSSMSGGRSPPSGESGGATVTAIPMTHHHATNARPRQLANRVVRPIEAASQDFAWLV